MLSEHRPTLILELLILFSNIHLDVEHLKILALVSRYIASIVRPRLFHRLIEIYPFQLPPLHRPSRSTRTGISLSEELYQELQEGWPHAHHVR